MLARADPGPFRLTFDGRPIAAREGDSVASALLAAGVQVTRRTPRGGVARGPYCMMGACFECLAEVDGVPNVQTCMTPVRDGMVVTSQVGARALVLSPSLAEGGQEEQAPQQGAARDGRVEPGHDGNARGGDAGLGGRAGRGDEGNGGGALRGNEGLGGKARRGDEGFGGVAWRGDEGLGGGPDVP